MPVPTKISICFGVPFKFATIIGSCSQQTWENGLVLWHENKTKYYSKHADWLLRSCLFPWSTSNLPTSLMVLDHFSSTCYSKGLVASKVHFCPTPSIYQLLLKLHSFINWCAATSKYWGENITQEGKIAAISTEETDKQFRREHDFIKYFIKRLIFLENDWEHFPWLSNYCF